MARHLGDGGDDRLRPMLHLRFKLLLNHAVAQPLVQTRALLGRFAFKLRRGERFTEMRAHFREPFRPAAMRAGQHPLRPAQITEHDLRPGLLDEKPRAIEEPLQAACAAHATLGKQDQLAAGLEMSRHFFQGSRRFRANQNDALVGQHPFVQLAVPCGQFRRGKFPVRLKAQPHEQPVDPRKVVRNQQRRAITMRGLLVKCPETKPEAQHAAHQLEKQSVGPNIHRSPATYRKPALE